jgi:transposase-like protein
MNCVECSGPIVMDWGQYAPLISRDGLTQYPFSVNELVCDSCGLVHNFDCKDLDHELLYNWLIKTEYDVYGNSRQGSITAPCPKCGSTITAYSGTTIRKNWGDLGHNRKCKNCNYQFVETKVDYVARKQKILSLGDHKLTLTQLVTKISKELKLEISVNTLICWGIKYKHSRPCAYAGMKPQIIAQGDSDLGLNELVTKIKRELNVDVSRRTLSRWGVDHKKVYDSSTNPLCIFCGKTTQKSGRATDHYFRCPRCKKSFSKNTKTHCKVCKGKLEKPGRFEMCNTCINKAKDIISLDKIRDVNIQKINDSLKGMGLKISKNRIYKWINEKKACQKEGGLPKPL